MTRAGIQHRAATPHLPARRAHTRRLTVVGALSLTAGLVALVPSGAAPAAAAPVTNSFCAPAGGSIPDDDTSGGRLLSIVVSGVPADVTDVDVRLIDLDEDPARDLDAVVAAPNGTYSYLASDVGGTSALTSIDVEFDDEAAGTIGTSSGSFTSGAFQPSNQENSENSHNYPAGFTNGPNATLAVLDASIALGTWYIWLVDDDDAGTGGSIGGACIDITSANTPPVASPAGALTTPEDTVLPITLPGSDADGQSLTYSITSQPTQGLITQVSGSNWQYTPPPDFTNADPAPLLAFTYQVTDGTDAASNSGTIRVTPVNDAPVAPDQSVSTTEDTPLAVTLSSSDVDGPSATFAITDDPDHGVLTGSGGSRSYQPATNHVGPDSFTFQVTDGAGGTDTATVSITVTAANDAPTADDDSYNAPEDAALAVAAPGVLDGDDDGDPEVTQTLTVVLVTGPANGVVTLAADGSFTYQPGADFTGIDSFTYVADDGPLQSAPATVTIDVGNVNDEPDADDDWLTTDEDTPLAITLTGDDPDGDVLSFDVTVGPTHGTLAGSGAQRTYAPAADHHGPDSFTFTVTDASGEVATGTVHIDVDPINDAPTGLADAYTTSEDVTLPITAPGVLANDADVDGDTLEADLVDDVEHGTLTLAADGSFTYEPAVDFHGSDAFTYTIGDGTASPTGPITVTITVDPANDAPAVTDESHVVDEDTTLTVSAPGVLSGDTDIDGDSLLASLGLVLPTLGTATVNPDGSFSYVPTANANGTDSFAYFANDGHGGLVAGTVTVTITPVNDAPITADQSLSTPEDTPLGITLSASDIDGDPPSFAVDTDPTDGDVTGAGTSWSYTPDPDFHGGDSVTFLVTDGNGGSATVTVNIAVTPDNDAPVADDESFTVAEDEVLTFALADLLDGDTDTDGDTLAIGSINAPSNSSFATPGGLSAPNGADLRPDPNFHGTITFDYLVTDGAGGSDTGTITVTVTPVNDAPVAVADTYTTAEDTDLVVSAASGVLDNDSDIDGDDLDATVDQEPTHGSLSLQADGSFAYEPDGDFVGTDAFTYTLADGQLEATGTVSIEVGPNDNDAPVAGNDTYTTDEDTPLVVPASGVLADDTDPDADDVLTVVPAGAPTHGTLTLTGDGSFTYVPDADYHGTDTFTYAASDGDVDDTATVTVHVAPVNDHPVGNPDTEGNIVVDEDGTLAVPAAGVLANDSDVDGDPLTSELATTTAHGTVSLEADGSFAYAPDADYHGTDVFTYVVSDGVEDGPGHASAAVVSPAVEVLITVNPINDAPVALDDEVTVAAGAAVPVSVLGNDTDADGDALAVVMHTPASRGTVDCATGTCTFTAEAADPGGEVTFEYAVEDPTGLADSGTVTVTVLAAEQVRETTTTTAGPTTTTTGSGQLPRTGADGTLWAFGAVLLGLGLCTSGTGALVRERVRPRRRPRHAR